MTKPKVLYIEDNEFNRVLVKRVLTVEDIMVIEAADGVQGLELALAHLPDLILVDINLPDVDGYELTAQFKRLRELRDIPVVALTANVMKGDKEKTLDAGCDGYIQKPVDVDRLPDQVRSFMKGT
jgi:two-component system cell cycle response regulator DivK